MPCEPRAHPKHDSPRCARRLSLPASPGVQGLQGAQGRELREAADTHGWAMADVQVRQLIQGSNASYGQVDFTREHAAEVQLAESRHATEDGGGRGRPGGRTRCSCKWAGHGPVGPERRKRRVQVREALGRRQSGRSDVSDGADGSYARQ